VLLCGPPPSCCCCVVVAPSPPYEYSRSLYSRLCAQFFILFNTITPDRILNSFFRYKSGLFLIYVRQLELCPCEMHPKVTFSVEKCLFTSKPKRVFAVSFYQFSFRPKIRGPSYVYQIQVSPFDEIRSVRLVGQPEKYEKHSPLDHFQAKVFVKDRFEGARISCRSNASTKAQTYISRI
jgi:hypothetical protein